jgi:hypothetical protein
MTDGILVKQELPNLWDYMAKDDRKWVIYIGDKFQDLFCQYQTKAQAKADAKKYNIKLKRA